MPANASAAMKTESNMVVGPYMIRLRYLRISMLSNLCYRIFSNVRVRNGYEGHEGGHYVTCYVIENANDFQNSKLKYFLCTSLRDVCTFFS